MQTIKQLATREHFVVGGFIYTDKKTSDKKVCLKYLGKKKNLTTGYFDDEILQEHMLLTKYLDVMKLDGKDEDLIKSSFAGLVLQRTTNILQNS